MFRRARSLYAVGVVALALSPPALQAVTPAQARPAPSGSPLRPRASQAVSARDREHSSALPEAVRRARRDVTITAYDLSLQIEPATGRLSALARLTVRNDGALPLDEVAFQVSSSLQWDAVSSLGAKLPFTMERVDTDADHTGAADEARIRLPQALSPGQRISLALFYSGVVPQNFDRLSRIDIPQSTAEAMDWDRIEAGRVALRGFGNVLWYPVAAPAVLLGEGAALAQEANLQKRREQQASVHLRVSLAYTGPAPAAAFFCGRQAPVVASAEQPVAGADIPPGPASGTAVIEFATEPLGFRPVSLFIFPTVPESAGDLVEVLDGSATQRSGLHASADDVVPLLTDWFGVKPERKLTLAVQEGESFADGSFVVAPARALEQRSNMAGALTHAWLQSAQPWLDYGIPELMSLLWLERKEGRPAALSQLEDRAHALSVADANGAQGAEDEGLLRATGEVALRTKSVAVLWMLRSLAGDQALQQAFQRLRLDRVLDEDPHGFERALEQTSGKRLDWFFTDWVDHDRGLPDLAIVSVTPHSVAGQGGRQDGSLVSVEVQNRGGAVAEVPVTVRSGALTATERLRVPAQASASVRVLFQGSPEEVQVNDGSVPEVAESVHVRHLIAVQP